MRRIFQNLIFCAFWVSHNSSQANFSGSGSKRQGGVAAGVPDARAQGVKKSSSDGVL